MRFNRGVAAEVAPLFVCSFCFLEPKIIVPTKGIEEHLNT